jgi:hypothetical protein
MSKHTPGPWSIGKPAMHRDYPYIVAPNGVVVCNVKSSMNRPQAKVDACLIAAAPELLAALKAILGNNDTDAIREPDFIAAVAAIARATGEQP